MAHLYDEAQTRTGHSYFVLQLYKQPGKDNQSHTPNHFILQGALQSLNRFDFMNHIIIIAPIRKYYSNGMIDLKKLIVEKQAYSEVLLSSSKQFIPKSQWYL
ncbi:unnamed protein product (macronuclear) [Paramecium tetraurelia]|uniref:Uncharacterized protein n=1 Tax=Paramecium tetraurelia TaxID=5888 RepID=A0CI68_PARTE|nr:uncharacterized protein GSPATT00007620001 [Paramecium tetraurelia]CAK70485.1 unnamed protein product [Paramecium tetraurelia]|eukprot:XP_001437882.1 hypothetical protein (macronuclear) [Paramecium tetraurelia strain d4-2]